MACRGVYFALTDPEAERLLTARGDEAVIQVIQEDIEARWDRDWLLEVDKAWDAIHRCLTDGTLRCESGTVLEKCVLGGRQLHSGADYIVSFLTPDEVMAAAEATREITKDWFTGRYYGLDATGYDGPIGEVDFEYTWENFDELRRFLDSAREAGRPVVFTVDQ